MVESKIICITSTLYEKLHSPRNRSGLEGAADEGNETDLRSAAPLSAPWAEGRLRLRESAVKGGRNMTRQGRRETMYVIKIRSGMSGTVMVINVSQLLNTGNKGNEKMRD